MHTLISVTAILVLTGVLAFGLLRVMQELIALTTPRLPALWDYDADFDDDDARDRGEQA